MTIDEVLDRIKKAYTQQAARIEAAANGVRNAVNAYEESAQDDALNQFLLVNGVPGARTGRRAENAALDLLSCVEALPELSVKQPDAPEEPESPEPETVATAASGEDLGAGIAADVAPQPFPRLRADGRPLLLFGGFVVEEKRCALARRCGIDVEWVSNERNGNGDGACDSAAARIRNGQFCGVIMLNELMSHRQSDTLVRAARAAGVHYAIGRKGGTGTLMEALTLFEQQRAEQKKEAGQ